MDFSLLGLWGQMGAVAKTVVGHPSGNVHVRDRHRAGTLPDFRRAWRRSLGYLAALQPLVGAAGRLSEAVGAASSDSGCADRAGARLRP